VTFGLLLASAVSGAAYTLAPGPAFLALLGIGAGSGRRAGALFLAGHFVGDVVWASLSLVAIIGARTMGTLVFDILGLACGAYLCVLGWRGLSNPKAYPVAVAMFTALLAGHASALDWSSFVPLLAAACVGFVIADIILVTVIGASRVRRIYQRHALWVTRISGVLFLGFGLQAISASGSALLRRG